MLKAMIIGAVVLLLAYVALGEKAKLDNNSPRPAAIAKINGDPHEYHGRKIVVAGKVENAVGLFETGAFWLRDNDYSQLLVISVSGIPPSGADVTVQGRLRQAIVLGQRQYQVLVEDGAYEQAH